MKSRVGELTAPSGLLREPSDLGWEPSDLGWVDLLTETVNNGKI
ncbi:MAG TPA: hypothetical protein VJZ70_00625 [Limnochordia bacterium]|nr:hypothetical protein [Limnochordia bacterium]